MSFQLFLLILLARRKVIVLTLLGVVAVTVAVSLLLPKQYTATASVVLDVKSPDPILGAILPAQALPGYMATQLDIIQSDRVAQRVVKMLKLDQNSTARGQWEEETEGKGTIESWLGNLLQKKLDVKPSRESSVINISFRGVEPQFAADVANAFARAYISTNLELKVDPAKQFASWFDDRTKALRENLEKSQAKLSAYQREKGIVAVDERLDVENARLLELSSQLVAIQGQKAESQSRQRQASGDAQTLPEVLQNPLIQGLKVDVSRQEGKLKDLAAQYGKNYPQLQRAEAELQSTREKLQTEIRRVADGVGTANRVNVQRESEIRAALDAQRTKVLEIKKNRDEISVLQRDVEAAQRNYDVVTQRLAQTSLESQTQQTNVVVLTPATEPIEPSFPKLLLNTVMAIFVGAMLGVGLALVLEMFSRRVRSVEDLTEGLGLPVLSVIDARDAPRRRHLALPKPTPANALPAAR